ncbi:hypothetical protein [Gemmata sp. SH-PL17]|uniref:hypothetical protein n=1 Tax=Gemmata sp. SH-PL17 TaxID=1630693 RepID=UPI0006963FB1|nr:hypothetical protein [Gemmata sp. SH-PL17]
MQFEERAFGCDPFGYLCMAKEVRRAAAEGRFPDYAIDTPHTRELIEHLKAQPNLPGPSWYTLTGPHAHHYQHRAGRVGPQYPPGTEAMLALFPRGKALHGLSITVIVVFSITGLVALGFAFVKRRWAAVGAVVLVLQTGFEVISRHGDASYSIIAVVLPLLVTVVRLVAARRWAIDRPRLSRVAAFLASFGFAVLVLFLLPGVAILVVGAVRYAFVDSRIIAFGLGAALFGTLPLVHHQHRVAGGWNVSTHGTDDAAPPSMKPVDENIRYYLYESRGAEQNVNLRVALLGFLGVVLLPGKPVVAGPTPSARARSHGVGAPDGLLPDARHQDRLLPRPGDLRCCCDSRRGRVVPTNPEGKRRSKRCRCVSADPRTGTGGGARPRRFLRSRPVGMRGRGRSRSKPTPHQPSSTRPN